MFSERVLGALGLIMNMNLKIAFTQWSWLDEIRMTKEDLKMTKMACGTWILDWTCAWQFSITGGYAYAKPSCPQSRQEDDRLSPPPPDMAGGCVQVSDGMLDLLGVTHPRGNHHWLVQELVQLIWRYSNVRSSLTQAQSTKLQILTLSTYQ